MNALFAKSVNIKNGNNANIGIFYFEMNNYSLKCIQADSVIFETAAIGWLNQRMPAIQWIAMI